MRNVVIVISVLVASVFVGVAVPTVAEHIRATPDVSFFPMNNDDIGDALASYAEVLCIQDKATDSSPEAWLKAASQCADSYRDDQVMTSSNDGGWRAYVPQASNDIAMICAGQGYEVCKYFKLR